MNGDAQMMTDRGRTGAVLFAKDVDRMVAFYCEVVGLTRGRAQTDHVVLESPIFQLVVHGIPKPIADAITIETPPVRRENTPVKLVFFVDSLTDARLAAGRLGGTVNPVEQEWRFEGDVVCDGHDPEGNIFQLRGPHASRS